MSAQIIPDPGAGGASARLWLGKMGFPWQGKHTWGGGREIVLVLPSSSASLLCGCSQHVLTVSFQFGEMVEDRSLFFFLLFSLFSNLVGFVGGGS